MVRIAKIFANNLIELRKQRGWSQDVLAVRSDLARGTIAQYEGELRWPGTDSISKIAEALGVLESRLFENHAPPEPTVPEALSKIAGEFGFRIVKQKRSRDPTDSAD